MSNMIITNIEEPICDPVKILNELHQIFLVETIKIDKNELNLFNDGLEYPQLYSDIFGDFLVEKVLEHYVSTILLDFSSEDIFIDIAASNSHYSSYIQRKGYEAYKQDLIYPKGIRVNEQSPVPHVGGNAAELPFRDNYFTKMTLHCSIEHFEGYDDVRFMKEAARVIKPHGRICMLPLYFGETYHIVTDPKIFEKEKDSIIFEESVPTYFKAGFGNRHCRVYSVNEFKKKNGR